MEKSKVDKDIQRKLEEAEKAIERIGGVFGDKPAVEARSVSIHSMDPDTMNSRLQEAERTLRRLEDVTQGQSFGSTLGSWRQNTEMAVAAERIALFGFLKTVVDRTQVSFVKFALVTAFLAGGGFLAALLAQWVNQQSVLAPVTVRKEVREVVVAASAERPQREEIIQKVKAKAQVQPAKPAAVSVAAPVQTPTATAAPTPAEAAPAKVQSPEEIQARQELALADKMLNSLQNSSVAANPQAQQLLGEASLALRQAHSLVELGQYSDGRKMALKAGIKLLSVKRQASSGQ